MTSPVLAITQLRKEYGEGASLVTAVDGITFAIQHNEIVGLLGPNGAGKTTTINMILGVLEPTSGSINVQGKNLARHRAEAINRTNFAAVYAPLPGNLTVAENLRIFGMIYDVKRLSERIESLIEQFDLKALRNTKSGSAASG
jgi:ABC-2 type transport system ATP-binding protein